MKLKLFQINTFTEDFNGGNPAGVIPLKQWLDDDLMQSIAKENNFSETAFFVSNGNDYDLRWFTPNCEIDLCGHATLATAFVLNQALGQTKDHYNFNTRSGLIPVSVAGELFTLDMPANPVHAVTCPEAIRLGLGFEPKACFLSERDDYLVEFDSEDQLASLKPNYPALKQINARGIIVTAASNSKNIDFVSRWFGSDAVGIDEDPVTGSAHATLTPYWQAKLNKTKLHAKQLSARKGELMCQYSGDRVNVSGKARLYFSGEIHL